MLLFERFAKWAIYIGMPVVHVYHILTGSTFLNTAAQDATGLEMIANQALIPVHYLLAGKVAIRDPYSYEYILDYRFDYTDKYLWHKTILSLSTLSQSLLIGTTLKSLSYLSPSTRERHQEIAAAQTSTHVKSNLAYYKSLGICMSEVCEQFVSPQVYQRMPGDENTLYQDKEALKEIVRLLNENGIPYWVDCGTCLGTYRYEGAIPWDWDIDISILQPDFLNAKHVLSQLDRTKYVLQDWSSRDKPNTYLKVYVRATRNLIDIYNYQIHPETKTLSYILSQEDCIFLPQSWKIREKRYKEPVAYDVVFPLKIAYFDGIEVFVPNQTQYFLQTKYGENLAPVKIYNPTTGTYEKDLSHPYWQRPHQH